jgi:hypothetical protein
MESEAALIVLDGDCPIDDADMDSAEHFSTASHIKVQTHAVDSEELTDAITVSPSVAKQEDSIESYGALIKDLYHSDNAKVNAALDALSLDLDEDFAKKCDKIQVVGGYFVLVQLMKKCLDKVIDEIPALDQVTELNELAELTTLHKALCVIIRWTFWYDESRADITAKGGLEAVMKIEKTFRKCQRLHEHALCALISLAFLSTVTTEVIESGRFEAVLAASNNHLDSTLLCEIECLVLSEIFNEHMAKRDQSINLGGGAAVAKVRTIWWSDNYILRSVHTLANVITSMMKDKLWTLFGKTFTFFLALFRAVYKYYRD